MTTSSSHSATVAHDTPRRGTAPMARRGLACLCLLGATFALGACGSGAARPTEHPASIAPSASDPLVEPNAVVATVAGHAITKATFAHVFAAEVKVEGSNAFEPVPPDFTACVQHLKTAPRPSGASGSRPSATVLKNQCQELYENVKTQALALLIDAQWVIGGAAEEGVSLSRKELEQEVKKAEAGESQVQAERTLAKTGRTLADFTLQTKVQVLGEKIRNRLARKTERPTNAQIAHFYDEHKALYGVPKRRDLEIAHVKTEAEAQQIKREIASGKTFASIVSKLSTPQPVGSRDGLLLGYEPGLFSQRPLDHAILAAKPNVLSGPVHITLGYYVFEVKRDHPPQQKALAQVQASIRRELPKVLYRAQLAAFVKAWRKRWTAKTDCRPGYVVAKCKQFKGSGAGSPESEDPYSL